MAKHPDARFASLAASPRIARIRRICTTLQYTGQLFHSVGGDQPPLHRRSAGERGGFFLPASSMTKRDMTHSSATRIRTASINHNLP